MSIQATYTLTNERMLVEASGINESAEQLFAFVREMNAKAEAANVYKVLCDERNLDYKVSILLLLELGKETATLTEFLNKVAIVVKPRYIEDGKFYENVVRNHGGHILVTTDYAEAEQWLQ